MNIPHGYALRPDGTLVRSASGRLLRVERTKRALSLVAAKRKKGA